MKLIVTGSKGQLGSDVVERCRVAGLNVIENNRVAADITNRKAIKEFIKNSGADAIIHCAAYTAVDKAEDERELCYDVNVNGTRYIAEACSELGIKMLYISTDYIFNGQGTEPWKVNDNPDPINYYGETKYLGEIEILKLIEKFFIIRISWVFGKNGSNFVKTMMNLAANSKANSINVVDDQVGSPTYTHDIAKLICEMIQTDKYGVYHATNEGYCSWHEFACEIFKAADIKINVNHISSVDYRTKAKRPLNSRLDKNCLTSKGFNKLPYWKEAVNCYIKELLSI